MRGTFCRFYRTLVKVIILVATHLFVSWSLAVSISYCRLEYLVLTLYMNSFVFYRLTIFYKKLCICTVVILSL